MVKNVTKFISKTRNASILTVMMMGVLTSVSAAKADELADVKAKGVLVCGTLSTTQPMGYTDPKTLQIVGFDVDVCRAVAGQLGVKMVQKSLSVESRIPELQVGRANILSAAMGYTKQRAQQIDFSSSHFQVPLKVLVPVSAGYKTLADLSGKRIGLTSGSTSEYWLHKSFPDIKVVTYHDSPSAFLAMQQHKVDGLAFSQTSGLRYLQAGKGNYTFIKQPIGWEPNALGIKKGEPQFLAAVNTALENLEKDGELDAIWNKWLGKDTPYDMTRDHKLEPIDKVSLTVQ